MMLGLSLRGAAKMVLVGRASEQGRFLRQLKWVLRHTLEQAHLYQAEQKGQKRRRRAAMAELGRDIARLANLVATTVTLSIMLSLTPYGD